MSTLLLRLAAPWQSWGTSSRFVRRNTDRWPSKSGVVGLLAAARGLRRTDPLEELLHLRFGVRVDHPGRVERDFQTARSRDGSASMPLSYRFYLADAVFLAALEGDRPLLEGLRDALRRPMFPLYLGRRSCPPVGPLVRGIRDTDAQQALTDEPWLVSERLQRSQESRLVELEVALDCPPDTAGADVVRDEPVSFDPHRREYGWRTVSRETVLVDNPGWRDPDRSGTVVESHSPFAAWEGLR